MRLVEYSIVYDDMHLFRKYHTPCPQERVDFTGQDVMVQDKNCRACNNYRGVDKAKSVVYCLNN